VARLFATLAGVAEARVRRAARRARLRAILVALAALLGLLGVGFLIAAATAALADAVGLVPALLLMAGLALVGLLVIAAILAAEARRARELAARREGLDGAFARAALRSAVPPRVGRPSRGMVGLGLVAVGALLVLLRGRDD
jgi:hypothetical protein